MRATTKRYTLTEFDAELEQEEPEKAPKSFFAERRKAVKGKARTTVVPITIAPRNTDRAGQESESIEEGDRPEKLIPFRKRGEVKQLANQSINYRAFVIATLIPTAWLAGANLMRFMFGAELAPGPCRLAAIATGVVWGCIVGWATNVPQVLYFYRPGGGNKKQRRLFVASAAGIFASASALVILGVLQASTIGDDPILTLMVASLVIIGILPLTIGCASSWRYIYF